VKGAFTEEKPKAESVKDRDQKQSPAQRSVFVTEEIRRWSAAPGRERRLVSPAKSVAAGAAQPVHPILMRSDACSDVEAAVAFERNR
jgi:hypothetical protein